MQKPTTTSTSQEQFMLNCERQPSAVQPEIFHCACGGALSCFAALGKSMVRPLRSTA
jgi:hypothetical protein